MKDIKFIKPHDEIEMLNRIRLGKVKKGVGIGVEEFDNHIRWKDGQFNMINGHDNVGKTDVVIWYFICMAKLYNKKFCIYSSENKISSQVFKAFNFWTGKRMDRDFLHDENAFNHHLNELSDCFKFIPINKRYSAKEILDLTVKADVDGALIDPFNSLITETGNKHQEDYDICADIRIAAETSNTSIFVNAHLQTEAARRRYPKDHIYEGHLQAPEKADTEGGQKFANRTDDFWSVHRMTQHAERWNMTELHVRKVKETITGGAVTPRESPIIMSWSDYSQYSINGKNPLYKTYNHAVRNQMDLLAEEVFNEQSDQAKRLSKMSYGVQEEIEKPNINLEGPEDDLPF